MVSVKTVSTVAVNAAKVGIAFLASVCVAEATVMGAQGAANDVKGVKALVKYKIDPTPVKVKEKGIFGKSYSVTVNPVTGQVKKYTGDKKPTNKKPVKVSKKEV